MILAVALATLISIPLLGLVTFVQLLYLESLRLRTRDLRSLEFFKETLEDKLGLKTEDGAGAFSLIKHTLLVLLGIFYFAWFADGEPWQAGVFWQAALAVWLTMVAVAYALPQFLYRRTTAQWLAPLVPALRVLAWVARPCVAVLGFFQSLVDLADDAAAAEAICEAVTRPSMRFVEIKSTEQQSVLVLHRVRQTLTRQRTQLSNAIRGHMGEHGLVAPVGRNGLARLIAIICNDDDDRLPEATRAALRFLVEQLDLVNAQILENDRRIRTNARATETGRRLMEIPGVGPVLASAIVAAVPDPRAFKCGRNLAAWIGLVPKQNSSGGKERLGSISKRGDRYLRSLFTAGALAVIRYAKIHGT